MTTVAVETTARLHFGFQNLSLAHERLYGGVGVGLAEPRLTVRAEPATTVESPDELRSYIEQAVQALGVEGATVELVEGYDRHVGLGSGTQIALAALVAIARAHNKSADPRTCAPKLGRGGRSGVGVATFESGGFVVDVGHPTERFTTAPPGPGSWTVPEPLGRWTLPDSWRFLLITPDESSGKSGDSEDESIRAIVERADGSIADDIATLLTRRLLPAVVEGDLSAFGASVSRLGRLNGAWFADEQGGVYRPPAGQLIDHLGGSQAIFGTGQSSWGPTVYGVTDAKYASEAKKAGQEALAEFGLDGSVRLVAPSSSGVVVRDS
jgi:beta-ribofuranosylaminobenzene 5'-phosphate synthase